MKIYNSFHWPLDSVNWYAKDFRHWVCTNSNFLKLHTCIIINFPLHPYDSWILVTVTEHLLLFNFSMTFVGKFVDIDARIKYLLNIYGMCEVKTWDDNNWVNEINQNTYRLEGYLDSLVKLGWHSDSGLHC